MCVRGAGAIHRFLVLLLLVQRVQRQGLEGRRKARVTCEATPTLIPRLLLSPQQSLLLTPSIPFTIHSVHRGRGLLLIEDITQCRCDVRRGGARQRVAAPVPPGHLAAVGLGGDVAVWRRGEGEGEGDDRLAGSVEQLDLATFEVLPL